MPSAIPKPASGCRTSSGIPPRNSATRICLFQSTVTAWKMIILPWKARKVPTVDIIDLDIAGDVYYWHTENDTLDKISPKTLQAVGDVIYASLPEIAKHIK